MSPLNAELVNEVAARSGKNLLGQPIDLSQEKFAVAAPAHPAPSTGYALLVFVAPWSDARVPAQWTAALEGRDMIFVSAAKSGNEANVLDRREPLALLAAVNIMQRYPIDRRRVFIGGFSGGARVALRLALGYPDVFHGALLNSGSDLIGTSELPLPPAELLRNVQETSRFAFVTGEHDAPRLAQDIDSRHSLQQWCIFNLATETMFAHGHVLADATSFGRALDALLESAPPDPRRLSDCRARLDHELASALAAAVLTPSSAER